MPLRIFSAIAGSNPMKMWKSTFSCLRVVFELAVTAFFALDLDVVEITYDAVNLALTERLELLQVVAVVRWFKPAGIFDSNARHPAGDVNT